MIEFHVEGMSCQHCVSAVTQAVQAVDADAQVDVDLAGGRVRVTSSADIGTLTAAIDEAGYAVQEAKTVADPG
jgi:copper chaperone